MLRCADKSPQHAAALHTPSHAHGRPVMPPRMCLHWAVSLLSYGLMALRSWTLARSWHSGGVGMTPWQVPALRWSQTLLPWWRT